MDDLMDMIVSNEAPTDISDKIKELIQVKAVEKIESIRPYVSDSMFNSTENEYYEDSDIDDED